MKIKRKTQNSVWYVRLKIYTSVVIHARISLAGRTRKVGLRFGDRGRVKMKNHIH